MKKEYDFSKLKKTEPKYLKNLRESVMMWNAKHKLTISQIPGTLGICRLNPDSRVPQWIYGSGFFAITRTSDELSLVCDQTLIPEGVKTDGDWHLFKVHGPLDFAMTGVMLAIARPLAEAKISIFAVSTFDTDYFLVKKKNAEAAADTLRTAGHTVS